ncbi:MAG: DNA primase, partial [Rhodobacteraceae bacterium]|nr:DNA primase [Paracoccaceae bacterium]
MSQFTDELMERVSLAEVIGRRVTWDSRKSRPQRGEHWACCPFHQEKTPSFKVDDHKGVYYCFGCHETGNAITFIRKTENLDYRETLHRLAEMAGMEIPKSEWDQTREESTHKPLYDVCEQACTQFQIALSSHAGKAARVYLEERGLNAQAIEQFEIGFAGQRNPGLMQILRKTGVSQEHLLTAGLCVEPDGGGQPYDRFRNRIMFPIRDLRGRLIGFGGRALDPAAPAKYLNSPETPIFKKGACLYNAVAARNALGKEESDLVVVEGYMDVIALSSYGIRACVAPLGTAITENQLRLLWKLAPEPVLALDGDSAGLRAAERVSDLALP